MSLAAAMCTVLAACGAGAPVEVPDLTGLRAGEGLSRVEAVGGLSARFDESPIDPSRCTVEGQSQTGEVERGTEVIISIACRQTVPDVTGFKPEDALAEVESVSAMSVEMGPASGDRRKCIIGRQRPRGGAQVPAGTVVVVYPDCR